MFEKEEEQFEHIKKHYDEVVIPDNIDQFIQTGIQTAKRKQKHSHTLRWGSMIACLLFLLMLTMIRVSPTFADYMSSIPGFEKVVELVHFDKGLLSAIENDFMQPTGVSDEQDGMKVTVDSVIVDEEKMILFYTVESNRELDEIMLGKVSLTDMDTNKKLDTGHSIESIQIKKHKPESGTIDLYLEGEWPSSINLSFQVFNTLSINPEPLTEIFNIPFTVDLEKFVGLKKEHIVNKTVSIKNQLITIQKVTVYPTRIGIHLAFDPENEKKIFNFDDLRIIDGKGEQWGAITNGIIATQPSENERIVYLQSNYFKEPEELYLEFHSVRALDKGELQVIVDVENQKLLKAPSDGRFIGVERVGNELKFMVENEHLRDREHAYGLFKGDFVDANGEEYLSKSMFSSPASEEALQMNGIELPTLDFKNPITLTLDDYPSRLTEKIRIKIK
jgi:hypothetical protein